MLKDGRDTQPSVDIYTLIPAASPASYELDLLVRANGNTRQLASDIYAAVRSVDAGTVVGAAMPLTERLSASAAQPRFSTAVLGLFAALALVLASLGLYSVLSYAVSQRRRELSVRAALGAARVDLVRMVVGEGLAVTAVGAILGLAAAALLSKTLSGLLFGVSALDPLSYGLAPIALLPVALVACVLPAVRAAAAAPAAVLRE
jgi:ABC-type antimicrobial peptide transport system permease subunit